MRKKASFFAKPWLINYFFILSDAKDWDRAYKSDFVLFAFLIFPYIQS